MYMIVCISAQICMTMDMLAYVCKCVTVTVFVSVLA